MPSVCYADGSFGCAVCINVVRHLSDRAAAYAEARRVLRGGPLLIRTTTQESERSHWAYAYFPTLASHQPPAQSALQAGEGAREAWSCHILRAKHDLLREVRTILTLSLHPNPDDQSTFDHLLKTLMPRLHSRMRKSDHH